MASEMSMELAKAWADHVDMEMQNSRVYLSIATRLKATGQKPLARMFKAMSKEEQGHALAFAKHLARRGHALKAGALNAIDLGEDGSSEAMCNLSLHREEDTLESMERLEALARQGSRDSASANWLAEWIVDQQHEVHRALARVYAAAQLGENGLLLASKTVLEGK